MDPVVANWLNRLGMLLGFVSFWLVAPEFIGEERLRRWEVMLEQGLRFFPTAFHVLLVLSPFVVVGIAVRLESRGALTRSETSWIVCSLMVLYLVGWWFSVRLEKKLIPALLHRLAEDEQIRARSLILGAWLFGASFLLQFGATFQAQPPPPSITRPGTPVSPTPYSAPQSRPPSYP
jgi:hypothetical protein